MGSAVGLRSEVVVLVLMIRMGCEWCSTVSEVRQPHVVVIEQVVSGVVERVVHDDLDCLVVLSHPMQRGCCNGLRP